MLLIGSFHGAGEHTVRASIQECQRDLQKVRTRGGVLQGELVVKNQRLADCEIRVRLQEVKKKVLEEQKLDLLKERQQLSDKLVLFIVLDCL